MTRKNEDGFTMVAVLMLLVLGVALGAATLRGTLIDAKSNQHYSTGNQAFAAAEAGLVDALNAINTRGVIDFQNDIVLANPAVVPTPSTSFSNFSSAVTYQITRVAAGTNTATQGILESTGNAALSAQRVLQINVQRGPFNGGAGALHLSNDTAAGSFSGNSMVIDGNNWTVTNLAANNSSQNNAACPTGSCPRPAISTRNDQVTSQVVTALAGQGTITGLGSAPSVMTTSAASTADTIKFVQDILKANDGGVASPCTHAGNNDYYVPGPSTGVHCVPQTKGNQGNGNQADFWGTLNAPEVTYVTDTNARIAGGSTGAGIVIFANNVDFHGNFTFCGWVLFLLNNGQGNGTITVGGSVDIYGTVWSPLPAFTGGGNINIKYSYDCLNKADGAGIAGAGNNIPHPMIITSWSEL